MPVAEEKILVVGPAWVGDMVMAQSLFMTLKLTRPEVQIDVLAPAWSLPLLQRMPQVRQGICLPVMHKEIGFFKRFALGRTLRQQAYDQAIVLPRSYKSALVPFFAAIPRRTGYRGEMRYGLLNDIRQLDKSILSQTVQRYIALGLEADASSSPAIPRPELKTDKQNQQRLLEELGLNTDSPVVALMPGAEYGPAKQWPVEYYAELAQQLIKQGQQVWVLGSARDQVTGDRIAAVAGVVNLCGRTRLEDTIDLLALCEQAVTNDSGLMHVACASGSKVIAIYGSSSPDYTPPLSETAEILYKNLDCSPCFKRECPLGHTRCLKDITAAEVMNRL